MSGIIGNVSSVGPLGPALDGAVRRSARKRAKATPAPQVTGQWFCPECGQRTDDPEEQARHLAREMSRLRLRLAEIQADAWDIPDYLDVLGDARELREALSDDDARRAWAVRSRFRTHGQPVPLEVEVAANEYHRRKQARYRARLREARSA